MAQPEIKADKINSPIQLMAAWFVMLILLSGVLLSAASQIDKPVWAAGYLIILTTALIIAVLTSVILMLTKFRPNLQEGKEYAEWLKDQNSYSAGLIPDKPENQPFQRMQKRIKELKLEAKDNKQASLIEQLEDSVLYSVSVSNINGSEKIVKAMNELGLETSIYGKTYTSCSDIDAHEAIWLGSKIPVEVALPVIKKAIEIWPHLKYISLSSDSSGPDETHWQIYLGGATSTALEERLQPWSAEEINNLEAKKITDFHAKIRSKYP